MNTLHGGRVGFDSHTLRDAAYLTHMSLHSRRRLVDAALARLGYQVMANRGWGMLIQRNNTVIQKRGSRRGFPRR